MMTSTASSPDVSPAHDGQSDLLGRAGECLALAILCLVVFFVEANRFDFIKTEALRAIVAEEMLETDGYSMPSVHHRPYLKKPPLYAWITATLARQFGGELDEGIARLPSNLAALGFVLLLYIVGEWAIGRHAGLAAATLAMISPTVVDYGMRAELDMGFTFWTTLSMLLVWPTIRGSGAGRFLGWLAVYAAALVAAMYKGPHSLIFLWLLIGAYCYGKKSVRWLFNAGQIIGLTATLGVLIWWTLALSDYAGARAVQKSALIELVSRLIPLSPKQWISILTFLPELFVILLPSSLLILCTVFIGQWRADAKPSLLESLRALIPQTFDRDGFRRYVDAIRQGAPRWWRNVAADPFAEFLLYWLIPNVVFMTIVPAKSSRYTLPIFAPVFLLAAYIVRQAAVGRTNPDTAQRLEHSWRGIFLVIGSAGLAGLIIAAAVSIAPGIGGEKFSLAPAWPWWVLGTGWIVAAAGELLGLPRNHPRLRWFALMLLPLAAKPAIMEIWWPQRVQSDTQRPVAARIEEIVETDRPIFVLGRHELPELAFYSSLPFYWVDDPEQAAATTAAQDAYFLIPSEDYESYAAKHPGRFTRIESFDRADRHRPLELVRFDLAGARPAPASAPTSAEP